MQYTKREIIGLCIVLFQILMAARYYTPLNNDIMDERFAWRMFSDNSLAERRYKFSSINRAGKYNGTAEIDLKDYFHSAWINVIRFGDDGILDKAAKHLCKRTRADFVKYEFRARFLDESKVLKNRQITC